LFKELANDYGKTVILITHDREVAQEADVQIELKDHKFTVK